MAGGTTNSGGTYSPWMGLIYVFNLIVGTGALTLPAAFANAGWIISLCVIFALGIISYITLTFVVETMATANAVLRNKRREEEAKKKEEIMEPKVSSDSDSSPSPTKRLLGRVRVKKKASHGGPYYSLLQPDEEASNAAGPVNSTMGLVPNEAGMNYVDDCDIKETVEMGKMARMFFNKVGTVLFFICIAIYLYGDLAIYGAAVGNSLRDVACTYFPPDLPCNATLNGTVLCWEGTDVSRDNAYRLFLSIFVVVIGSFAFFNVQKTMLLQILTSLVRWSAFIVMIALACIRLATLPSEQLGHHPIAEFSGIPNLFGACVYSFMCHHSLPSLITPISPKRGLYRLLISDYILIAGFYLLLGFTGFFAFPTLQSLYTLNFVPDRCSVPDSSVSSALHSILSKEYVDVGQQILSYFLALFPVFTLSTSFPIISITLRNNLKQLFLRKDEKEYSFFIRRIFFPLLALIPPTIVALATSDIQFLVGITGSYAGAGVQYIVPALLVYYSRKALIKEFGINPVRNVFASPFKHSGFVFFVLAWSVACIGFVTYNHIATGK